VSCFCFISHVTTSEIKLKRNCFVSVLFQFYFRCNHCLRNQKRLRNPTMTNWVFGQTTHVDRSKSCSAWSVVFRRWLYIWSFIKIGDGFARYGVSKFFGQLPLTWLLAYAVTKEHLATQRWTWFGSIHELDWVGSGRLFGIFRGLGGLDPYNL